MKCILSILSADCFLHCRYAIFMIESECTRKCFQTHGTNNRFLREGGGGELKNDASMLI